MKTIPEGLLPVDPSIQADYVFSQRYPERAQVYATIAHDSERVRAQRRFFPDLPYGLHPREMLDLFPGKAGAPLLVFIHGGYWRSMDKSSFSYVAAPFLDRGISVAVVGYPLAPEVPVGGIVQSIRKAVVWLANQAGAYLPDVQTINLCGHSAGGHLAAMASVPDEVFRPSAADGCVGSADHTTPPNEASCVTYPDIAGCVTLSGIFDLLPLVQTSIGRLIGLSAQDAIAWSPIGRGLFPEKSKPDQSDESTTAPWLLAAVGTDETASFLDQTGRYVHHWTTSGGTATSLALPGLNHYNVLLELGRPGSVLMDGIFSRLAPGGKKMMCTIHDQTDRDRWGE